MSKRAASCSSSTPAPADAAWRDRKIRRQIADAQRAPFRASPASNAASASASPAPRATSGVAASSPRQRDCANRLPASRCSSGVSAGMPSNPHGVSCSASPDAIIASAA
jgi:hypothetical protein